MASPITRCKPVNTPSSRLPESGHMQSDIDAQLANSFEEASPRDFMTAMRGYDRQQVDEHIKQVEADGRQHREQAQAMQRELSEAHRQIREQERPTYSGLGTRIEQ